MTVIRVDVTGYFHLPVLLYGCCWLVHGSGVLCGSCYRPGLSDMNSMLTLLTDPSHCWGAAVCIHRSGKLTYIHILLRPTFTRSWRLRNMILQVYGISFISKRSAKRSASFFLLQLPIPLYLFETVDYAACVYCIKCSSSVWLNACFNDVFCLRLMDAGDPGLRWYKRLLFPPQHTGKTSGTHRFNVLFYEVNSVAKSTASVMMLLSRGDVSWSCRGTVRLSRCWCGFDTSDGCRKVAALRRTLSFSVCPGHAGRGDVLRPLVRDWRQKV